MIAQIAHVIREIRTLQQTPYKIEMCNEVANYLLDTSRHRDDDELYQMSLCLEPRLSRLGTKMSTPSVMGGGGGGGFGSTSPSTFTPGN